MLEVQNLSVTARNGTQLLKQISFQIEIGEAVGLTGQSGAGKTTLLRILMGLEVPDSGTLSGAARYFERRLSGQRRHDPGGWTISVGLVPSEAPGTVRNDPGLYPAKSNDCL